MKTIKVSIAEALKASRKERRFEKGIWRKTKPRKESIFETATKPALDISLQLRRKSTTAGVQAVEVRA